MPKKTPLYNNHVKSSAKIVDFHGWSLPMEYEGVLKEHQKVRNKSGLFDTSHMGRIFVAGDDSKDFLQHICTNNLEKLKESKMLYTTACNDRGKMLDDFMVYRLSDKYICAVNAANRDKIYNWLCENKKEYSVNIEDKSDSIGMIAFQGPLTEKILSSYFDVSNLFFLETKQYKHRNKVFIISRSGYTGEDGFEIMADNDEIVNLWQYLIDNNRDSVFPCGLAVRDMLRLEMGYSLYGNDIDETTTPFEANLNWILAFNCDDFIGKKTLFVELKEGVRRKLKGFIMIDRAMPRSGYDIFNNGEKVGKVTSGGYSPTLKNFIGMAYIKTDLAIDGNLLDIKIRDKLYKAKVQSVPFIKPKVKRRKNTLS